ncbi:MAG: T9SS type A sorting domain-containing protein [bacterium]
MNFRKNKIFLYKSEIILLFIFLSQLSTLAAENEDFNLIIPDFQVNDELQKYDYGSFVNSKVVMRNDGSLIMVFEDRYSYNNYYGYSDIYVQLFDSSGMATGPVVKVNDNSDVSISVYPAVGVDNKGNFVIVWEDYRGSDIRKKLNADIYAQCFDNDGQTIGHNIKVNDSWGDDDHENPRIIVDNKKNFIIVWRTIFNDSGTNCISMKQFDDVDNFQGSNEKILLSGWEIFNFDIAVNNKDGFMITWEACSYHTEIYAKRFDSYGHALGTTLRVSVGYEEYYKSNPKICINRDGYFIIAWEDGRNFADIYAKIYDKNGQSLGSDFRISNQLWGSWQDMPEIGADNNGNFLIAWDVRDFDYNFDVYAQRIDSTGTALGSNFKVSEASRQNRYGSVNIKRERNGNLLISWKKVDGISRFLAQRYNPDGIKIGSNFSILTINPDAGEINQKDPDIGVDSKGSFLIAWEDERNGHPDIYAQRFNADGTPSTCSFIVNDDERGINYQFGLKIATNNTGNSVIVWRDYRNEKAEIYAQRFDVNGTAISSNVKIDNDQFRSWKDNPDIGMDRNGNFVIVWQDYRNKHSDIYAQRVDANGNVIGPNFKVNDDKGSVYQYTPKIAMNDTGNTVIVWRDKRNGHSDIYLQRYNANGSAVSTNIRVNDDTTSSEQSNPVIDINKKGNFVIAWKDKRNNRYEIYAQRFNDKGIALGSNFRVITLADENSNIAIGVDKNGKFVIAWQEKRNGVYDIHGQLYDNNGEALGYNFKINKDSGNDLPLNLSIVFKDGKLYSTWVDRKDPTTGLDIFANVISFTTSDVSGFDIIEIPNNYALSQNYPNPFNPSTTIKYDLPKAQNVIITVYDIQGRFVSKIVDEFKQAGRHSVEFYADNLASGVYFYRLQTEEFTRLHKMMLVK